MNKLVYSLVSPLSVSLVAIGSCLIFLASHTAAEQKSDQKNDSPEVITTVTPNEVQQKDQVRPEFLQPVPGIC